jgi:hypothetical protein
MPVLDGAIMVDGPPIVADPRRAYVAGGKSAALADVPRALPRSVDEAERRYGSVLYDRMEADPAVSACLETVKQGILSSGIQLTAAVEPEPGVPMEQQTPEVREAAEALDYCRRLLDRLERPIDETIYDLLNGLARGCKLGELVWRVADRGPDAGRLVLDCLDVKPNNVWTFAVDWRMKLVGVVALSRMASADRPGAAAPGPGRRPPRDRLDPPQHYMFSPEHFFIFSWLPRDGDPRGRSQLRAAFEPWNFKVQTRPRHFTFLCRFGQPRVVLVLSPNAKPAYPLRADGTENTAAAPVMPHSQAEQALEKFDAGTWMVVPDGTAVELVESRGNGAAFIDSFKYSNIEIALGIMQNTRTVMEAESGSKADSQTGQDITRGLQRLGQRMFAARVEDQVLWRGLAYNFDEDYADRNTPVVGFGDAALEDFAPVATAFAAMFKAGMIQPDQLAWIMQRLGIKASKMIAAAAAPQQPGGAASAGATDAAAA